MVAERFQYFPRQGYLQIFCFEWKRAQNLPCLKFLPILVAQEWNAILRLSLRFGAGGFALKVHDKAKTVHDLLLLTARTMPNSPIQVVQSAAQNTDYGEADPLLQAYYSISAYGWGDTSAV